jgi:D-lactate dehydrogenase (cytochrome)
MRENVLSLKVVLADGRIVQTSRRAKKSAAGYDLTRLFVGSEGTLRIITEVTVKLHPVQAAMSAAVCAFPTIKGAADTVIQTLQSGIPIARSELLCATTMAALNRHNRTQHREMPTLLLEFHGSEAGVVEQAQAVQELARENGGLDFQWATRPEERSKLWEARHQAYFACLQLKPGARAISTDVCVPISRLAECVVETSKDIEKASLPVPLFGHVGDGNFHLVILIDPNKPAELEEAKALNVRVVKRALAMEGTCTGEHGIGIGKQPYLVEELGDAVDLMRDVKKLFDPDNLMNPGKVVPL